MWGGKAARGQLGGPRITAVGKEYEEKPIRLYFLEGLGGSRGVI